MSNGFTNQTAKTSKTLYTRMPNVAVVERIPELGKAAVLVYLLLAYHADWKTGKCRPSISCLAREGGFRRTTVCEALGTLESHGLIKVERGRGGAVNEYTLTTLCGSDERDTTPRPDSNERDTQPSNNPATQIVTIRLLEQEPLTNTNEQESKKPAGAGDIPADLASLIDGWNSLGEHIVKKGNGARREPPAKAVVKGWRGATADPERREAFKDIPVLLEAIRTARFCHRQDWFSLPWLFGFNKKGEPNGVRVINGLLEGETTNGNGNHKSNGSRLGRIEADAESIEFYNKISR